MFNFVAGKDDASIFEETSAEKVGESVVFLVESEDCCIWNAYVCGLGRASTILMSISL